MAVIVDVGVLLRLVIVGVVVVAVVEVGAVVVAVLTVVGVEELRLWSWVVRWSRISR